jgi:hypothetical protein
MKGASPAAGITDQFAGKKLKVTYDKKTVTITDVLTGQSYTPVVSYYFTWEAFYPNTEIYQSGS